MVRLLLAYLFVCSCSSTIEPTLAPSYRTTAPTASSPTSATLPLGMFQTDCLPLGLFYNRATVLITANNGFTYTNELFSVKGCPNYDARVVASTSQVVVSPSPSSAVSLGQQASIDVHVTSVNVTISSSSLIGLFSSCDGGKWVVGQSRALNKSCVVFGVILPSPQDCPVYYSTMKYTATDIQIAEFYSANGTNITCSLEKRFTNFSAANTYKLGGYGAAPTCEKISSTSVCSSFIDFPVSVPFCPGRCSSETCQSLTVETDLYLTVLPQVWSVLLSPLCRVAVGRLFCSIVYSRCNTQRLPPCSEACSLNFACSGTDQNSLDRLLSLLNTTTSELCSNTTCASPPPLPSTTMKEMENVPTSMMSTKISASAVAYPTCAIYDGEVCKGVITGSIYVPSNTTLQQMEQLFEKEIFWTFGLAPKGECFRAFTQLACASVFNPCDIRAVDAVLGPGQSVPVPLPRVPCREMCEAYSRSCKDFIALAPAILTRACTGKAEVEVGCVNGSVYTNATGMDLYPVNQTVLQAAIGLSTYCNVLTTNASASYQCNFPTLKPDSETSDTILQSHCSLPCDAKVFNPFGAPAWNRFFSAFCVISFFACFWTVITFLVFRDSLLKSQTQIYAFHCIFAVFLATTIPIPVIFYDPASAITYATCIDNTRPMTISHPYCAYSGLFIAWTTLTTGLFLNAFVMDLFLVITLFNQKMSKQTRDRLATGTFVGIYLFALIFVIATGATGNLRHSNLPYCFVANTASDVFWATLCISLVVDIALFGWVCKTIFASFRAVTQASSASSTGSKRSIASQYRRPILFTLTFIVLFVVAITFRIQVRFESDKWTEQTIDWFICNLVDARVSGTQCADYPPGPNHGFYWLCNMLIFSQGLIITIIFGFTSQNFRLWRTLLLTRVFPRIGLAQLADRSAGENSSEHDRSSNRAISLKSKRTEASLHTSQASRSSHQHTGSTSEIEPAKEVEASPVARARTGSLFISNH